MRVINFPKNKNGHIYDFEKCSGCCEPYDDNKKYIEVTMPFAKYTKHILLCKSCEKVADGQGVFG